MSKRLLGLALGVAAACSGNIDGNGEEPSPGETPSPRTGGNVGTAGSGTAGTAGTGGTGPSVTPPPPPAACNGAPLQAAPAPVRRLTKREYNYTVRDLLVITDAAPAKDFIVDAQVGLFENNADSPVTPLSANNYGDAAEALARTAVTSKLTSYAPCANAAGDDNCARDFVKNFGKRAYRRPLTDPEVTRLFLVYTTGKADGGHANGIRMTMQTMLQSPNFFNHVERGVAGAGGAVLLTQYELASRLSYFLWNTMPDVPLFTAADTGKLATAADVEAQTMRMLADPKAKSGVYNFFFQWLNLDTIDKVDRSTTVFNLWSSTLRQAMRDENRQFVEEVLWKGDAKLTTLLSATFTFANSKLAPIYGLSMPAPPAAMAADNLVRVELDPTQRAGLLTQTALLATTAHYDQTSPVHRGLLVRERFLCQTTPSPPPEVDVSIPKPDPKLTTRERFARHQADPTCAGCHRLIDNIGLGFEAYDAIGKYRTTESGKPVDVSGEIVGSRDLDGKFSGVLELTSKLAKSAEVRDCMASQWLSYAIGNTTSDLSCAVSALGADFAANGTDIRKLILAVTKSDAFRHRKAISKEVCR